MALTSVLKILFTCLIHIFQEKNASITIHEYAQTFDNTCIIFEKEIVQIFRNECSQTSICQCCNNTNTCVQ